MTNYSSYGVNLSERQKVRLARAIKNNSPVTLRLGKNGKLSGKDELMLTKSQIGKIKKAAAKGTGVDIKISKTEVRKAVGGSVMTSLAAIGAKALPMVTKFIPKVAAPLATGAVSALGSLGVEKLFGSGQTGGFLIPDSKIDLLIKNKGLLTKK